SYWAGLCAGRSGVGLIGQFDTSAFRVKIGGEVKGYIPEATIDARTVGRLDRFSQFALTAALQAGKDSRRGVSEVDPFRCGAILGSGIGGMREFEEQTGRYIQGGPRKISPFVIPKMMPNAAPGNLSIHFNLRGPNTAVATACASAANAFGDAMR